jgi:hypothetical protein
MIQNLVLNNSDHAFSAQWAGLQASDDQPKVVATPGTDAAVASHDRAQLESGALTSAGSGVNAEYSA